MDLLDLLEVDAPSLHHGDRLAADYCCRRWHEAGRPAESAALVDFLDHSLKACVELKLHYPSVLLLRLKQLKRGDWLPRPSANETDSHLDQELSPAEDQRPDPEKDLMDAIRAKQEKAEFDEGMRALVMERQRRARERG